MTSRQQRLRGSHIFSNEQDCSYNTPQLENEDPSCSVGVLTQSSRLNTGHNPCLANTQCFPLYHDETSSFQTSMFSQNQHEHCPSHSASLLFVQDIGATDSSSINHDLMTFFSYPGTLHEYIDFGNKTFNWKIKLSRQLPTPQLLDDLLNNIFGQKSKKFRANIRAYNSMFAFTSMGVNVD
uniref:Uncharacterized protein n=1 Tax=Salix viminalis TaxID=40686 RepID=A0A6N2LW76_SALVM